MPSILYMGDGVQLEVQRVFSGEKGLNVFHLVSGDYVYGSGKPISHKNHLSHLPKPYLQEALKWFDAYWGQKKKEEPA